MTDTFVHTSDLGVERSKDENSDALAEKMAELSEILRDRKSDHMPAPCTAEEVRTTRTLQDSQNFLDIDGLSEDELHRPCPHTSR